MTAHATTTAARGFRRTEDCRLEDLLVVLAEPTDLNAYPHADRVEQGVRVYDAAHVRPLLADPARADDLRAEIARECFADAQRDHKADPTSAGAPPGPDATSATIQEPT